jgi:hypothetical protein
LLGCFLSSCCCCCCCCRPVSVYTKWFQARWMDACVLRGQGDKGGSAKIVLALLTIKHTHSFWAPIPRSFTLSRALLSLVTDVFAHCVVRAAAYPQLHFTLLLPRRLCIAFRLLPFYSTHTYTRPIRPLASLGCCRSPLLHSRSPYIRPRARTAPPTSEPLTSCGSPARPCHGRARARACRTRRARLHRHRRPSSCWPCSCRGI